MNVVQSDRNGRAEASPAEERPIVSVANLRVEFETDGGTVVGVKDVGFAIRPGETLCVVGESGSGKSVTSLSLMRLVEFGGGRITAGRLAFTRETGDAIDLASADAATMRAIRGNEIGMIFQEPMTALNPILTIGQQIADGLRAHKGVGGTAARAPPRGGPAPAPTRLRARRTAPSRDSARRRTG